MTSHRHRRSVSRIQNDEPNNKPDSLTELSPIPLHSAELQSNPIFEAIQKSMEIAEEVTLVEQLQDPEIEQEQPPLAEPIFDCFEFNFKEPYNSNKLFQKRQRVEHLKLSRPSMLRTTRITHHGLISDIETSFEHS